MTTLPSGITRYTGANAFTAEDAEGKLFYAFQTSVGDRGVLVMVKNGVATDITPAPIGGRPSLECGPYGLYLVGNKETGSGALPPRYRVPQYVPWPTGALALAVPASDPLWQLYGGTYTATDMDTPAEVALRVTKQLAALRSIIALLVQAGVIVKA